jgi:hypothetical protein
MTKAPETEGCHAFSDLDTKEGNSSLSYSCLFTPVLLDNNTTGSREVLKW